MIALQDGDEHGDNQEQAGIATAKEKGDEELVEDWWVEFVNYPLTMMIRPLS